MSDLLRIAFERLESELSESEQDMIARRILALLESDERDWDCQFAGTLDALTELADKALAEYYAGETELIDPKKL